MLTCTISNDAMNSFKKGVCHRGNDGGRACNNKVVSGSLYCKYHACTHDGCTASKSSSSKACSKHLQFKPRAQSTATAGGAQQQQQKMQLRQPQQPPKQQQKRGKMYAWGSKRQSSGVYGFAGNGSGEEEAEEV